VKGELGDDRRRRTYLRIASVVGAEGQASEILDGRTRPAVDVVGEEPPRPTEVERRVRRLL